MSHNNKTPQSVLDAPSITYTMLEGTEHEGPSRQEMRRWGQQEGFCKSSMSQRKKTEHPFLKEKRERLEAAIAAIKATKDNTK